MTTTTATDDRKVIPNLPPLDWKKKFQNIGLPAQFFRARILATGMRLRFPRSSMGAVGSRLIAPTRPAKSSRLRNGRTRLFSRETMRRSGSWRFSARRPKADWRGRRGSTARSDLRTATARQKSLRRRYSRWICDRCGFSAAVRTSKNVRNDVERRAPTHVRAKNRAIENASRRH